MLFKTRGIVFRYIKFRETSIIVTVYTEEFGIQSYIVNGIRSARSRQSIAAFAPLSLLEMVVYHREQADLQRISDYKRSINLSSIQTDIRKSSIAMFISEVLYKSIRDSHPSEGTFAFIFHSIEWLETAESRISTFHLQFLIKLTKYLGFGIEHYVSDQSIELIRSLGSEKYGSGVKLSKEEQKESLERLIQFYQEHIEGFGNVKSLAVLREVFSN